MCIKCFTVLMAICVNNSSCVSLSLRLLRCVSSISLFLAFLFISLIPFFVFPSSLFSLLDCFPHHASSKKLQGTKGRASPFPLYLLTLRTFPLPLPPSLLTLPSFLSNMLHFLLVPKTLKEKKSWHWKFPWPESRFLELFQWVCLSISEIEDHYAWLNHGLGSPSLYPLSC